MGWVLNMAVSEQGVKGSTPTNTGIVAKLNLNPPNCGNGHIAYVPSEGKHFPNTCGGVLLGVYSQKNPRISVHVTYCPWKQDFRDHAICVRTSWCTCAGMVITTSMFVLGFNHT